MEFHCKSSKLKWNSIVDFLKKTAKLQYKICLDGGIIKDIQLCDNMIQPKRRIRMKLRILSYMKRRRKINILKRY